MLRLKRAFVAAFLILLPWIVAVAEAAPKFDQ